MYFANKLENVCIEQQFWNIFQNLTFGICEWTRNSCYATHCKSRRHKLIAGKYHTKLDMLILQIPLNFIHIIFSCHYLHGKTVLSLCRKNWRTCVAKIKLTDNKLKILNGETKNLLAATHKLTKERNLKEWRLNDVIYKTQEWETWK